VIGRGVGACEGGGVGVGHGGASLSFCVKDQDWR
jgi:hypothetical protein